MSDKKELTRGNVTEFFAKIWSSMQEKKKSTLLLLLLLGVLHNVSFF